MKGIVNVPGGGGGSVSAHNVDPKAHPDLRNEMEDLKKQPSELEKLIEEHDSNKAAHADIREKVEKLEQAQAKTQPAIKYQTVKLTVQGWSAEEKTQKVTVTGVSAKETDQLIIPTPALANQEAYLDAGILATAQEANSLTFTATSIPEEELTVYVTIIPFGGAKA